MVRKKFLIIPIIIVLVIAILLIFTGLKRTIPIEGNVTLFTYESPQTPDQPHIIGIRTEMVYSCSGFTIDRRIEKNDNRIDVFLDRIIKPDGCLTAIGSASTNIDSAFTNNGVYDLYLHTGEKTDRYTVNVANDGVTITPVETTFSSFYSS